MAIRDGKVFSIIAVNVFAFLFVVCSVSAEDKTVEPFMKYINTNVQLKENEWVRIAKDLYYEETLEDVHKRLNLPPVPDSMKNMLNRGLLAKIQFLKPCKAKTWSDIDKEYTSGPMRKKYNEITMYLMFAYISTQIDVSDKEKKDIQEVMHNNLLKMYPDADKLIDEYFIFPKYNCDYRTKIFCTFYNSSGIEIKTDNLTPFASGIDETKRKLEIYPGETTYVTFSVPDEAVYWYVWVPK